MGSAVLSALLVGALSAAGSSPPRPRATRGTDVTPQEARELANWCLAQPRVAARLGNHRTRLLRAALTEISKDGRSGAGAVLWFRDYDAGVVQPVTVNLDAGSVETGEPLLLVQPSPEEIREGMTIVLNDPALAPLAADQSLTLMGGFHNKSPWTDDPCSREVCLEFAFMRPGAEWNQATPAPRAPPRRVIVNLSRGAVVNRDYRTSQESGAPPPRMTAAVVSIP